MKRSFITDEATQSFDEAVAFAKAYHLQGLELRSVADTAIDLVPEKTLKHWRQQLDNEGLAVSCLSGSFYKCDIPDSGTLENEMVKLERLCDAADILGCRLIRGFSFFAPAQGRLSAQQLAPFFESPATLLRKRGKQLLLEADPSVNTTNHWQLASLLSLLDNPCFGAIYDPGNDLYDSEGERPYPEGYEAVAPWLRHVHIKDAALDADGQPQCMKPGTGQVDYPGLLRRLIKDGYKGWLSLETHYRIGQSLTEAQMRTPFGGSFSSGGMAATAESAMALEELLAQAQQG